MLAIIGGTGLNQLSNLDSQKSERQNTPYGFSAPISQGNFAGCNVPVLFLPRHGDGHHLPPHLINYRANVYALKSAGATQIIGVNAVGGIRDDLPPGAIFLPDQIIDYTFGREHTYFTGDEAGVDHIDFTYPYSDSLRQAMRTAANKVQQGMVLDGVYGCTQGPRLETATEIRKLQQDGCAVVGMTGMPEAALARELNLSYAAINLVVNWAAGLSAELITMEGIRKELENGMSKIIKILAVMELK